MLDPTATGILRADNIDCSFDNEKVYQDTSMVRLPKLKRLHRIVIETHQVFDETQKLIVEKICASHKKRTFNFWDRIKIML